MLDDTKPLGSETTVNDKIADRIGRRDYLQRLEAGYKSRQVTIMTPLAKRLYLRFFDVTQLSVHVVSVAGRANLKAEHVDLMESQLVKRMSDLRAYLENELDGARALMQANGIEATAMQYMAPLAREAKVISPISRVFLDAITTADELISGLELLVLEGIVQISRGEQQKSEVRNRVRKAATAARQMSVGVRKLAQQEQAKRASDGDGHGEMEDATSIGTAAGKSADNDTPAAPIAEDSAGNTAEKQLKRTRAPKADPAAAEPAAA
jgi:hypothetical protein